jgi:phosphoglucosamine mutase
MDTQTALKVGQAIARSFGQEGHRTRVVIGRDTRISGYALESALAAGICSMGGDVYLAGVLPTPAVAFVTRDIRADAGIVISASHNPFQDNGIKVFGGDAYKLPDEREEGIEALILGDDLPGDRDMGRAYRIDDAAGRYTVFAKSAFPSELSVDGLKLVLDVGNGATYQVGPAAFSELGAEIEVLHNRPDGRNINLNCGSQHTQDLRARVVETEAAAGLAFDGDGDRLIAVDETGQELTGDQIIMILACAARNAGQLSSDTLVTTVMSNIGFGLACKKEGFKYHASKVGDRYVLEDMKKLGGVMGGEESGHIILLDHHTTGDGIIAAMRLVAAMVQEGKPLSELARLMKVFPQKLINVEVTQKPAIDTVPEIVEVIRQVEAELGEEGRVLVRFSGTQNMCRVMVEGPSDELTAEFCETVANAVKKAIG